MEYGVLMDWKPAWVSKRPKKRGGEKQQNLT